MRICRRGHRRGGRAVASADRGNSSFFSGLSMIRTVSEIGGPGQALSLVYSGLAAAVVWGLVVGGVVAWIAAAVRGGGKADD